MPKRLSDIKAKSQELIAKVHPYEDILIFVITLFVANYFWKFTVVGDESGVCVTWFGLDVTAAFDFMARYVAWIVYWLTWLFRDSVYLIGEHTIRFASGSGMSIIWGCSGLKQMFIWTCLILTVSGGWKQKTWYIPIGWICCHAFNILRIFVLALLIEHHAEWFHPLHDYLFKYLFYLFIFVLWVIFVEKIRPSSSAN